MGLALRLHVWARVISDQRNRIDAAQPSRVRDQAMEEMWLLRCSGKSLRDRTTSVLLLGQTVFTVSIFIFWRANTVASKWARLADSMPRFAHNDTPLHQAIMKPHLIQAVMSHKDPPRITRPGWNSDTRINTK